jgi:hypothetical protein
MMRIKRVLPPEKSMWISSILRPECSRVIHNGKNGLPVELPRIFKVS